MDEVLRLFSYICSKIKNNQYEKTDITCIYDDGFCWNGKS